MAAWLLTAAALEAQTVSSAGFTSTTVTAIPDGNPVGVTEWFAVSGLTGSVTNVQVQLDITGGFNGDLYAYLVSPQGQMAVLLNRVGLDGGNLLGYSDAGFRITLDGAAANNVHFYQSGSYTLDSGQLTGTWAADGRNINPQSPGSAFASAPTTSGLNLYNGLNGGDENGAWTLFLADLSGGGSTPTLNQAILTIMTVPEPASLSLGLLGGTMIFWLCGRRKK